MKPSSQEEWDHFWKIYIKEDDAVESTRMRTGLAAPRDSEILKKYVFLMLDISKVLTGLDVD